MEESKIKSDYDLKKATKKETLEKLSDIYRYIINSEYSQEYASAMLRAIENVRENGLWDKDLHPPLASTPTETKDCTTGSENEAFTCSNCMDYQEGVCLVRYAVKKDGSRRPIPRKPNQHKCAVFMPKNV